MTHAEEKNKKLSALIVEQERQYRDTQAALRHAAKILRVDNYDRGSRITEALAILDAALTGEGT